LLVAIVTHGLFVSIICSFFFFFLFLFFFLPSNVLFFYLIVKKKKKKKKKKTTHWMGEKRKEVGLLFVIVYSVGGTEKLE